MESSIVSGLASMTWSTMHMHLQTAHKSDISLPRLRGYACGQQGCQLPEVEIRDTLIGGFGRSKPHRKLHFGTVIPITHNTNTCIRLLYYTFCNMVVIRSPIHTNNRKQECFNNIDNQPMACKTHKPEFAQFCIGGIHDYHSRISLSLPLSLSLSF